MNKYIKLLLCLGLFAAVNTVMAQETMNTPGYHDRHNPSSVYHTGRNQQPSAPPVRWADR